PRPGATDAPGRPPSMGSAMLACSEACPSRTPAAARPPPESIPLLSRCLHGPSARLRRVPRESLEMWAQCLVRDFDQGHSVYQAVGQHEVAVPRDRGVAHDVATPRDRPTLELLGFGIEAHDRI